EAGFAEAEVVVEDTFETPRQMPAFIETESGVAWVEEDVLVVQSGAQNPFRDRREIARSLGIPAERIRVHAAPLGGGFGGKDGITVQIHLALAAWWTKRPVRLFWDRAESGLAGWKRHPFRITLKTGARRDGALVAQQARVVGDTGAYVGYGPAVVCVAAESVSGPYRIPNVRVDAYCVLTNNTPSGAVRGFGAVQACLAMECQMDALAEALSADPLELRKKNALRKGDRAPLGNVLESSVRFEDTLAAVEASAAWKTREAWKRASPRPWVRRGVGVASGVKGVGLGHLPDRGAVALELTPEGTFRLGVGLAEMGEGITTGFVQIAAEALGCAPEDIELLPVDTDRVPECGGADASRSTMTGGNAILRAAPLMEALLRREGAALLEVAEEDLELRDGRVRSRSAPDRSVSYGEIGGRLRDRGDPARVEGRYEWPVTDEHIPGGMELPHLVYAFATHLARVEVDTLTGRVRVLDVVAAHDVGRVINPQGLEGQSEGGALYSAGLGLWEDTLLADGVMKTPSFTTYLIGTAADAPEVETPLVEGHEPLGPFGAKGAGEIVTLPTAAAVVNAIRDAAGVRIHRTPATPERVFWALREKEKAAP
ncbi:MAG: xanthine dehydrogenase family protein molybdopterin-binding subunit, partial [Nitrospinota bacterium]